MQWPVYNRKVRNLTFMVTYLIAGVVIVFGLNYETPEQKAIREYFGVPKRTLWPIIVGVAVVLAVVWVEVYLVLFKVEERRRRYIALSVPAGYFLSLPLSHYFWWGWAIGPAVMLAIVVICWLYPARNTNRGQA
jgi:hypothetical protein